MDVLGTGSPALGNERETGRAKNWTLCERRTAAVLGYETSAQQAVKAGYLRSDTKAVMGHRGSATYLWHSSEAAQLRQWLTVIPILP